MGFHSAAEQPSSAKMLGCFRPGETLKRLTGSGTRKNCVWGSVTAKLFSEIYAGGPLLLDEISR